MIDALFPLGPHDEPMVVNESVSVSVRFRPVAEREDSCEFESFLELSGEDPGHALAKA